MKSEDPPGQETTRSGGPAPVQAAALRDAMGRFVTGVTIVTVRGEAGEPYGLTVNSFNSVSLDPPLVLWSLDLRHDKLELFRAARGFAVNVMGASSKATIRRFAEAGAERFEGTGWHWGASGQPVLDDAIAWFECRLWAVYPGGDHSIVVGEVVGIGSEDGPPATLYKGELIDPPR